VRPVTPETVSKTRSAAPEPASKTHSVPTDEKPKEPPEADAPTQFKETFDARVRGTYYTIAADNAPAGVHRKAVRIVVKDLKRDWFKGGA